MSERLSALRGAYRAGRTAPLALTFDGAGCARLTSRANQLPLTFACANLWLATAAVLGPARGRFAACGSFAARYCRCHLSFVRKFRSGPELP